MDSFGPPEIVRYDIMRDTTTLNNISTLRCIPCDILGLICEFSQMSDIEIIHAIANEIGAIHTKSTGSVKINDKLSIPFEFYATRNPYHVEITIDDRYFYKIIISQSKIKMVVNSNYIRFDGGDYIDRYSTMARHYKSVNSRKMFCTMIKFIRLWKCYKK